MIIITGAAGFIGSCLSAHFSQKGHDLLLVDDFSNPAKWNNTEGLSHCKRADRMDYIQDPLAYGQADLMLHIGARTDTAEMNTQVFDVLNFEYSKSIWTFCADHDIPLIYASSAATYGDGSLGFSDKHALIPSLKPLNPYGQSKQDFDLWALEQEITPPFWAGLKFFNVFGPNEYHKKRMASVVFHAYQQIKQHGSMKLFRSHRADFEDGKQLRDFVYIKDLVRLIDGLTEQKTQNGIYNLGSGEARTFLDLAEAVFSALEVKPNIEFIDIPVDIRENYQYYTEADMSKWKSMNIQPALFTLEEAIADYVTNYLAPVKYYQSGFSV